VTLYSVYERRSDEPVVVSDRFSWSAALLPPVHALFHGLWLMLALWVVGTLAIAGTALFVGAEAGFWLYVLFAAFLGFEASTFLRIKTAKAGGQFGGDLIAADEDLALVDYLKRRAS